MSVLSEICVSRRTVTTIDGDAGDGEDVMPDPPKTRVPLLREPQPIPVYVDTGWGAEKTTGRSIPISRESLSSSRSRCSSISSGFSDHSSACPSPDPSGTRSLTPGDGSPCRPVVGHSGVVPSPRLGSSSTFRTLYGLTGQPGPLGQSLRNLQGLSKTPVSRDELVPPSSQGLSGVSSSGSRGVGEGLKVRGFQGLNSTAGSRVTRGGVGGGDRGFHSYQGSNNSSSSGVYSEDGNTPRFGSSVNKNNNNNDNDDDDSSSIIGGVHPGERRLPARVDVNANFSSSRLARGKDSSSPDWTDRHHVTSRPLGQSSFGRQGHNGMEMRLDHFLSRTGHTPAASSSGYPPGSRALPGRHSAGIMRSGPGSPAPGFPFTERSASSEAGHDPLCVETQRLVEGLSRTLTDVPSPPRVSSPSTPGSPEVSRDQNVPSPPARSPVEVKVSPRESTSSGGSFDSSDASSPSWRTSPQSRSSPCWTLNREVNLNSRDPITSTPMGNGASTSLSRSSPWSFSLKSEEDSPEKAAIHGKLGSRARTTSWTFSSESGSRPTESVVEKVPSPRSDVWNHGPKGVQTSPQGLHSPPPPLPHKTRISTLSRGILGLNIPNGAPPHEKPESLPNGRTASSGSASSRSSGSAGESHKSCGSTGKGSRSSSGTGESQGSCGSAGEASTSSASIGVISSSAGSTGDSHTGSGSTVDSRGSGGACSGESRRQSDSFVMDLTLDLTWEQRKQRMTNALDWLLKSLYGIRDTDDNLLAVFKNIGDTIEHVKQQRASIQEEGSEEDLDEEDEAHWEDWEISEFDRSVAQGEEINYDRWEERAHPRNGSAPSPLPKDTAPSPPSPTDPATRQNLEAKV